MNDNFAKMPKPPYYAVIFSNSLNSDVEGYQRMAENMHSLAINHPGCIGAESSRDETGFGITVSYWQDESSIKSWKADAKHLVAQRLGIEGWYQYYQLRVAKVERSYSGPIGRIDI